MIGNEKVIHKLSVVAVIFCVLLLTLIAGCGGGGGGGGSSVLTGAISGRAFDSQGNTVGGAKVTAGTLQTTTASDGRFLLNNVPAGSVNVVATKTSPPITGQQTVTVQAGVTTSNVNITLFDAPPTSPT